MKINQIVKWFRMVCKGIRDEYEAGASTRKLSIDVDDLREMLEPYERLRGAVELAIERLERMSMLTPDEESDLEHYHKILEVTK